jgi:hypothetical protein
MLTKGTISKSSLYFFYPDYVTPKRYLIKLEDFLSLNNQLDKRKLAIGIFDARRKYY